MSDVGNGLLEARALEGTARQAMAAGDFAGAVQAWEALLARGPGTVQSWLNLAASRRAVGQFEAAQAAVEGALKLEPRNFMALLMRASLLERAGHLRQAGAAYGNALLVAPPDRELDPATLRALAHARTINTAYGDELAAFIRHGAGLSNPDTAEARRVDRFIDLTLGRRKRYVQEPVGYFYPGLPAIEFWERDEFPWLPQLEAASDDIKRELAGVLEDEGAAFEPYIDYKESAPLDQWAALNRSPRWGAYYLLRDGERLEDHCRRCPRTMEALSAAPQPRVPSRSPSAMFSALDPHTHIPPHTGVSNTRLVVHLPLIVPPGCWFRVGNETRTYQDGRAWVFDDTIEHEAMNDSDQGRIILLFDVWNPRLSQWEREMIAEVSARLDEFNGAAPPGRQGL